MHAAAEGLSGAGQASQQQRRSAVCCSGSAPPLSPLPATLSPASLSVLLRAVRPLTEDETKVVFEKLHKFIGKNIKALVERGEAPHCLRLQKNRVFYVREDVMRRATNVSLWATCYVQGLLVCSVGLVCYAGPPTELGWAMSQLAGGLVMGRPPGRATAQLLLLLFCTGNVYRFSPTLVGVCLVGTECTVVCGPQ